MSLQIITPGLEAGMASPGVGNPPRAACTEQSTLVTTRFPMHQTGVVFLPFYHSTGTEEEVSGVC